MALNDKQSLFVEEYLKCFNRTQAAIAAGYSSKTAYSIGAELLKKPEIEQAISNRLTESAMSADEVLRRLAEHARGDIDDYLNDDGQFDLPKARRAKKTGLIKKLKTKRTVRVLDDTEYVTTEVEFELYDAQAALVNIGKHHGLFVDKTESKTDSTVRLDAALTHAIDSESAQSIFDILAAAGAIATGTDAAEADGVHTA